MSVKIIADSASDISQETAAKWGITIMPLKVRFGEDEYLDGKTLSNREFYEKLIETDEVPKTSQIPPAEYMDAFEAATSDGSEVVCMVLSSGVSGCIGSANIAADDFDGKVHIIDTQQFSISYYILVQYAVRLRDEGKSAEEIAEIIEKVKSSATVLSVFDTLEYLKAGGRLSQTAAFAGKVLSIKPVITITDGQVEVIGKARGSKNGNNMLKENIKRLGGVDFDMPICFGYTGLSDDMLQKYLTDCKDIYEGHMTADDINIVSIGACIGTYAGPGAIATAFFPKGS